MRNILISGAVSVVFMTALLSGQTTAQKKVVPRPRRALLTANSDLSGICGTTPS